REAILKLNSALLTEDFKNLLDQIFLLKDRFLELTLYTKKNGSQEVDTKRIEETFELNRNEKLIYLIAKVKAGALGFEEPTLYSEMPAYQELLEQAYFGKEKAKKENWLKLCYAKGEMAENVDKLSLKSRYSLNKMYVTEPKNYASVFEKKKFKLN